MSPHGTLSVTPDPGKTAVSWLLGTIFVFAPLFRAGHPALAVAVLELLSVLLLAVVLWQPRRIPLTRSEILALTLLFAVPLLYLIPLPVELVERLPGRGTYLAGRALLAAGEAGGPVGLSLHPTETESALLLLLLPIAVFMGTRALGTSRKRQLLLLLLALAALQSLLGILQYSAGEGNPLFFGMAHANSARGTYVNANHLAGLLEMLLPVALALMVYSIGRDRADDGRGWKRRILFFSSARGQAAFVYGALASLLLVGLIFTRSRTGIMLSILAVLLSMAAFARRIGGTNVHGPVGTILTLAVGTGIVIGLVPVLDRFSVAGAMQDQRWTIFSATLEGIGAFLPIGSGPGTYPDIFPAFQPLALGSWFVNHADNDYLEWVFEGGLLAAALILLLLVLYARQWVRVWTWKEWSHFRFVQVAAGIGLLLLLLHSLMDFNLHVPANIAYFAFLAGLFFSDSRDDVGPARSRRRRTTRRLRETRSPLPTPPEEQAAEQAAATGASVRDGDRDRATDREDGDNRNADGPPEAPARPEGPSRTRKTLVELTRRIPRLLLVQMSEAADGEASAREIRALGDRLTAYVRAVEQYLALSGGERRGLAPDADRTPADIDADRVPADVGSKAGDKPEVEGLQKELESVIGALDAFVDQPDRADGLAPLKARLRDAEQRLPAVAG